jgi:uncharacterized protein (DUF2384 family)
MNSVRGISRSFEARGWRPEKVKKRVDEGSVWDYVSFHMKQKGKKLVMQEVAPPLSRKTYSAPLYSVQKLVSQEIGASALIPVVRAGLRFEELEELQSSLGLPMEKLAAKLGISKATLHRRKATGRLDPGRIRPGGAVCAAHGESGGSARVQRESARQWLSAPQFRARWSCASRLRRDRSRSA